MSTASRHGEEMDGWCYHVLPMVTLADDRSTIEHTSVTLVLFYHECVLVRPTGFMCVGQSLKEEELRTPVFRASGHLDSGC